MVELPTENEGYKYEANYHVMVDAKDARLFFWLNRKLSRLIEHELLMGFDEKNELGNRFSIKDTKKLGTQRALKRFAGSVLIWIELLGSLKQRKSASSNVFIIA